MKRFVKLYGASPLHLLALLASLALAGYVAQFLHVSQTSKIAHWFMGAAVLHDLLLLPLYAIADFSLTRVWRHSAPDTDIAPVRWLNYVRFPAAISLLLLLVYWPQISRRHTNLHANSNLSTQPYLSHWLLVTGILFLVSALSYAIRSRRSRSRETSSEREPSLDPT